MPFLLPICCHYWKCFSLWSSSYMHVPSYVRYHNRMAASPLYAMHGTRVETSCQRNTKMLFTVVPGSLGSKEKLQNIFPPPYITSSLSHLLYPALISVWPMVPESPQFANQPPLQNLSLPIRVEGSFLATCSLMEIIYCQKVSSKSLYLYI